MKVFNIREFLDDRKIFHQIIGDEVLFECPMCGRAEHFYFNSKSFLCNCQKCKWEGNLYSFLVVGYGFKKKDAMRLLRGFRDSSVGGVKDRIKLLLSDNEQESIEYNIMFFKNPLPKHRKIISSTAIPKALKERGIGTLTAASYGIQVCTSGPYANRLIFPVETLETKTFIAATGYTRERSRRIKEAMKARGVNFRKTKFPKGSDMAEVLYAYNEARRSVGIVYVVEGHYDVISMRHKNFVAVGTFGSKISMGQAILISMMNACKIFIMLDGDVPKTKLVKYSKRVAKAAPDKVIRICILPKDKDPDDASKEEIVEAAKTSRTIAQLEREVKKEK